MSIGDRYKLEDEENWRDHVNDMPASEIRAGYKIQVLPPFGGALMRFRIIAPDNIVYSIYFDVNGALGAMNVPYYELYPYSLDTDEKDDTKRYYRTEFNDILMDIYIMTEGLDAIREEFPEYYV